MPDFKQSRESQIIYDLFRNIRNRDPALITWDELLEATGKQRRTQIAGAIMTATRRARKDDQLVIECDRGLGYRLRIDKELSISGQRAIDRSRRIQRTGLQKMDCADISKLDAENKAIHNVRKSVLELGMLTTRPRTVASVTQMVMRKHNQLDEQELLAAAKEALSRR